MRDQEDLLVLLHYRLERADRFFTPHEERDDHMRKDDDVTQRQHGELIAGRGRGRLVVGAFPLCLGLLRRLFRAGPFGFSHG